MKVVMLGGKHRDGRGIWYVKENIRCAEEVAIKLWRLGLATICPHKNTAFFDGAADDNVWIAGYLEIMNRCDALVLLPNWKESAGARGEKDMAETLGMPVFIWPQDEQKIKNFA